MTMYDIPEITEKMTKLINEQLQKENINPKDLTEKEIALLHKVGYRI